MELIRYFPKTGEEKSSPCRFEMELLVILYVMTSFVWYGTKIPEEYTASIFRE
jgi:hypothetical protein